MDMPAAVRNAYCLDSSYMKVFLLNPLFILLALSSLMLNISACSKEKLDSPTASISGGEDAGGGEGTQVVDKMEAVVAPEIGKVFLVYFADPAGYQEERILLNVQTHWAESSKNQNIIKDMYSKGFSEHLESSVVHVKSECSVIKDGKKEIKSATALMDKPQSPICFSPWVFSESVEFKNAAEVFYGLMIHEFAHHYGHMDEDHSLASEITQTYLSSRRATEDTSTDWLSFVDEYAHQIKVLRGYRAYKDRPKQEKIALDELDQCWEKRRACQAELLKPLFRQMPEKDMATEVFID